MSEDDGHNSQDNHDSRKGGNEQQSGAVIDGSQVFSRDYVRRFLFDNLDVRGELVKFDQGYADILRNHQYPSELAACLGEFLLASILLSVSIKYQGRLILQVAGKGPVSLIMAECTSEQEVRGIVRYDEEAFAALEEKAFTQFFEGATLAITIMPDKGENYQGLVPLQGENLAECLGHYFEQSEQLATLLKFAVNPDAESPKAAGFMLQQLPVSQEQKVVDVEVRQEQWDYTKHLAMTLTEEELLSLESEEILHRLYHEEDVRLFPKSPAAFVCPCSRERYREVLISLGEQELKDILEEQGKVSIQCEFCNNHYDFLGHELGLND